MTTLFPPHASQPGVGLEASRPVEMVI